MRPRLGSLPFPAKAWLYNAGLALALGPLVYLLFRLDPRPAAPLDLLFWGLLAAWVQSTQIVLPLKATISQLFIVLLAALLVFPLWVPPLLVLAFYLNPRFFRDRGYPLYAEVFNRLQNAASIAVGALVYHLAAGLLTPLAPDLAEGLAVLAGGFVFFFVNITLVAYMVALDTESPLWSVWQANFSWLSLSYLVLTPVALLFARLYTADPPVFGGWGGWPVLLFLVPLYYARYHWDEFVRLQGAFEQTVETLMATLDAKDAHTRLHSERVAAIAVDLAKAAGLDAVDREKVRLGARVHDIGKLAVPDRILFKPGRLTEQEFARIKRHPTEGEELLRHAPLFKEVLPIVRNHHERWDGRGYPDGLAGEAIHPWARIVALADAYEAMTAGRPYRPAKTPEEALAEVLANAGTQFDPGLVPLFQELWETNPIWRDREVFLRTYSSAVSSSGSSPPSSRASGSATTPKSR